MYYCNQIVNSLIMKTNLIKQKNYILAKSHVMYEIERSCWRLVLHNRTCTYRSYSQQCSYETTNIGASSNTSSIMEHLATHHNPLTLPFDEIQQNVSILKMLTETNKLFTYEAFYISDKKTGWNRKIDNFINPLKLFSLGTIINIPPASDYTNNISTSLLNCIPPAGCRYTLLSRAT